VFTLFLALFMALPLVAAGQNGMRPGALSIIEAGFAADGVTPRYTIEANGADIRDVLSALLRKTGKEYAINQDVTGPVSFVLRDKTLEEILERLQAVARPAISIQRGAMITVATVPPSAGESASRAMAAPTGQAKRTGLGQQSRIEVIRPGQAALFGGQAGAWNRPVNLAIPDDRPIPLRTALRQIEVQTQVPIRLDPRVPTDIGLAARFTDTPLSLVLDSIGRTGALKWQSQSDGSILIAPTDWMLVTVRGLPVWGQPANVCPSCRRPVLPSWSFCPYDGVPLKRSGNQVAPGRSR
jgi:hypothetical protein